MAPEDEGFFFADRSTPSVPHRYLAPIRSSIPTPPCEHEGRNPGAGKLAPAAELFARAILTAQDSNVITFADETRPISEVFLAFLDAQPKVIEFSELATATAGTDEPEIFAKLGITGEQVEKHRSR